MLSAGQKVTGGLHAKELSVVGEEDMFRALFPSNNTALQVLFLGIEDEIEDTIEDGWKMDSRVESRFGRYAPNRHTLLNEVGCIPS